MSSPILIFALTTLLSTSALAIPGEVARDATRPSRAFITPKADLANAGADSDFAGAALKASSTSTFTSVAATFTIPTPSVPSGQSASKDYHFSLWAGIELCTVLVAYMAYSPITKQGNDYSLDTGLLQTGCDIETQNVDDGHAFQCWVEYYPDPAIYLNMYPKPGDHISVGVKALSPTSGVVAIKNLNGTATFTSTMFAPKATATILGPSNVAEFFLETTPTPTIPAFKPAITFTNANVYNKAGALIPLAKLPVIEVQRNGKAETKSNYTAHGVTIQYVAT